MTGRLIPDTLNWVGVALAGRAPNKGPFSPTSKTNISKHEAGCCSACFDRDAEIKTMFSASLVNRHAAKLHN